MRTVYLSLTLIFLLTLVVSPVAGLWLAAQTGSFYLFPLTPVLCMALTGFCAYKAEVI